MRREGPPTGDAPNEVKAPNAATGPTQTPCSAMLLMPAATPEKTGVEPEDVMWGTSLETGQWKEPVATDFTLDKATLDSPFLPPIDFRAYTPINVFMLDEYDGTYSICAIQCFHPARTQRRMNAWEAVNEGEKPNPVSMMRKQATSTVRRA